VRETVIDASVSAAWILPDETSPASEKLLRDVLEGRTRLVEPALWEYEMLNVLQGAMARHRMDEHGAKKAVHLLSQVPVEIVPMDGESRPAVLEACLRHGLSAYDAAYLVLADLRGISLLSADSDLLSLRSRFSWIKSI
jgi:predicted nucleic acid-binding protein